jgi:hypothetical protein
MEHNMTIQQRIANAFQNLTRERDDAQAHAKRLHAALANLCGALTLNYNVYQRRQEARIAISQYDASHLSPVAATTAETSMPKSVIPNLHA